MDAPRTLAPIETELLASLFVHITARSRGAGLRLSDDEVTAVSHECLGWLDRKWTGTRSDALEWTAGRLLERIEATGKVHRISARVKSLERPVLHRVPTPSKREPYGYRTALVLTLEADDGTELRALPVVDKDRIDLLTHPATQGAALDLTVLEMALPDEPHGPTREFGAFIIAAKVADSSIAIVGVTRTERIAGEKTLARLARTRKAPWRYLYEQAVKLLGVQLLEKNRELALGLQAAVLVALSWGRLDSRTAKISILFVSDPGQGKHFAHELLRRLSVRFASALSSNLTGPGIVGQRASAVRRRNQSDVAPLFRRGQHGTCSAEDLHAMPRRNSEGVYATFQKAMDSGVVSSGASRGDSYDANCSLVLDTNWPDNLGVERGRTPSVPFVAEHRPVVSRLDAAFCLRSDPDRAAETARTARITIADEKHEAAWRALRVMVALLIDRHPTVNIDGAQREIDRVVGRFTELARANDLPFQSELLPRSRVSATRFAVAIARGSGRSKCTAADARDAEAFVTSKIDLLAEVLRRRAANVTARDAAREAARPVSALRAARESRLAAVERALETGENRFGPLKTLAERELGGSLAKNTMRRLLLLAGARLTSEGRWEWSTKSPVSSGNDGMRKRTGPVAPARSAARTRKRTLRRRRSK